MRVSEEEESKSPDESSESGAPAHSHLLALARTLNKFQGMGADGERNTKATAKWDWIGFPS